jgi:hypothetical protein
VPLPFLGLRAPGRGGLVAPGARAQCIAHHAIDRVGHRAGVSETDFGLLRVHVHVDQLPRKLDEDRAHGVAPGLQRVAIGGGDGAGEGSVLHGAAEDEQVQAPGAGAGAVRSGEIGFDARRAARTLAGKELVALEHLARPLEPALCRQVVPAAPPVADELEAHPRVGQREAANDLADVRRLRGDGPQELSTGRHVVKQIRDHDGGAGRRAAGAHPGLGPAFHHDLGTFVELGRASPEQKPAHRSDARQRLAPKSEALDRDQIFRAADLARGVALESQAGVIPIHAVAIVADRQAVVPPPSMSTTIRPASASTAFSTSSFTTLAGRVTTSPAAI